jgi:hypothetical protein
MGPPLWFLRSLNWTFYLTTFAIFIVIGVTSIYCVYAIASWVVRFILTVLGFDYGGYPYGY